MHTIHTNFVSTIKLFLQFARCCNTYVRVFDTRFLECLIDISDVVFSPRYICTIYIYVAVDAPHRDCHTCNNTFPENYTADFSKGRKFKFKFSHYPQVFTPLPENFKLGTNPCSKFHNSISSTMSARQTRIYNVSRSCST